MEGQRVSNTMAMLMKGNLNISNLELQEIPEEVYAIYEIAPASVVVDFSSRASGWYESVDLQRFNASGNEIAEIGDRIPAEFGAMKHFDVCLVIFKRG